MISITTKTKLTFVLLLLLLLLLCHIYICNAFEILLATKTKVKQSKLASKHSKIALTIKQARSRASRPVNSPTPESWAKPPKKLSHHFENFSTRAAAPLGAKFPRRHQRISSKILKASPEDQQQDSQRLTGGFSSKAPEATPEVSHRGSHCITRGSARNSTQRNACSTGKPTLDKRLVKEFITLKY